VDFVVAGLFEHALSNPHIGFSLNSLGLESAIEALSGYLRSALALENMKKIVSAGLAGPLLASQAR
jgi:hypothetical protein